jgi:hypothetical protein
MTDINLIEWPTVTNSQEIIEMLLSEALCRYFNVDELPELSKLEGRLSSVSLPDQAKKFLIDGVVFFEVFAVSSKYVVTDKTYTLETAQEYWMIERRL